MEATSPLGPYPTRITDALEHWAAHAPDRTFLAQRRRDVEAGLQARLDASDGWRRVSYRETLERVRRIAQALIDRQLSPDRPIVILSGNGIDHALLALAAMYVGVPYAPIAPAYSLQAREYSSLQHIFDRVEPALVFTDNGAAYERALRAVLTDRAELVVSGTPGELRATSFAELESSAGHRCRRRREAESQRRHHREGALHLGIDRTTEGRHQHAADALLQPGKVDSKFHKPRAIGAGCPDILAV